MRILLLSVSFIPAIVVSGAPQIWPAPQSITSGDGVAPISPTDFKFSATKDSPVLEQAFDRFRGLFFPHTVAASFDKENSLATQVMTVNVKDVAVKLGLEADESYELLVDTHGVATLTAPTVWGALQGLQTMSQLITYDFSKKAYLIEGLPLKIEDQPRFPHRGILIDSGRHFEPVPVIKRFIDSLTYAKFNVLHWHLTEDQSFPLESRKHPELTQKGAWSPREQYTAEEITDLVEYARVRGVRVIPEFDMPGHSSSWRNSHPEIFATGCLSAGSRGAFDPALPSTFEFLEDVLQDWTNGMFTDEALHLGSDEVPSSCWNNTRDQQFMKQMNFTDVKQIFDYFVTRMVNISKKLGKETILWDEAFMSANPPKEAIIQNWHDASLFQQIVEKGYRGIFSPNGGYTHGWYLDGLGATWQNMYALDPMTNISSQYASKVLGGEGCMWGETVDPSDLEFTVWPRAAAIAERLWSPSSYTSVEQATPRLEAFRCLMLERGVNAGFVGGTGRQQPPGPGSCSQSSKSTTLIV